MTNEKNPIKERKLYLALGEYSMRGQFCLSTFDRSELFWKLRQYYDNYNCGIGLSEDSSPVPIDIFEIDLGDSKKLGRFSQKNLSDLLKEEK